MLCEPPTPATSEALPSSTNPPCSWPGRRRRWPTRWTWTGWCSADLLAAACRSATWRRSPALVRAVQRQPAKSTTIEVVGTGVGEDVGAVGAACLVLEHTLAPRAQRLLLEG